MTASRLVTRLGALVCLAVLAVGSAGRPGAHLGRRRPAQGRRARAAGRSGGRAQRRAGLRARSGVAQAAAEQLDHRRRRRARRGRARSHLGLPPPARALDHRLRRAGRAGKDEKGRPISAHRPPAAVRPAVGVLRAGAVGARVRQGGQPGAGVGRPGRSRLPRKEVPRAGRLHLAGARARHLRRPPGLRLHLRQRPGGQLPRPVSLGAELRQRLAHPEVQGRRHVRLPDRHGRRERARTATTPTAASTARRSRSWSPT